MLLAFGRKAFVASLGERGSIWTELDFALRGSWTRIHSKVEIVRIFIHRAVVYRAIGLRNSYHPLHALREVRSA